MKLCTLHVFYQTYILSVKFAFSVFFCVCFFVVVFFFNYIKLLSNKGHYPNDRCQMMVVLWSFECNVFGNYLIESKVVTNKLIGMALHVLTSTDKGSSFVAQN